MKDTWKLNLLPRLRYRLRTGHWCSHVEWGPWHMVNTGMQQIRWCADCSFPQVR